MNSWKMQKCPTCLEPLTSGSRNHTVSTPCGHLFHMNCVQGWIDRGNQTCPQCRSHISKDKLFRIYLQPTESDVQTPHDTDENQQHFDNSRWSKIANSVAYFSETNSVSLNSPSDSAGAVNELSNPEVTRSSPSTGVPRTNAVQYIRTNTFANVDEMVVNRTQNCDPTPTNNEPEIYSYYKKGCCYTFSLFFIIFFMSLLSVALKQEQTVHQTKVRNGTLFPKLIENNF